jgi:hypothetical protein
VQIRPSGFLIKRNGSILSDKCCGRCNQILLEFLENKKYDGHLESQYLDCIKITKEKEEMKQQGCPAILLRGGEDGAANATIMTLSIGLQYAHP